jgi:hypothetical protein
MEIQSRNNRNATHNSFLFLCKKCASMTSDTRNAETLNSKQGFRHSSRQELALSSRDCRFCFWLWSQLYKKWGPGSRGTLYLKSTGKEKWFQIIKVREDGRPYIDTISVRDGLDTGDLVQGEVKFSADMPGAEEQLNIAKFEVVGRTLKSQLFLR